MSPRDLSSRLDPAVRARVAVLRRGQSASDQPRNDLTLDHLVRAMGVERNGIRRLRSPLREARFYLLPIPVRTESAGECEDTPASADLRLSIGFIFDGALVGAGGKADLDGLLSNEAMFSAEFDRKQYVGGLVPDGVVAVSLSYAQGPVTTVKVRDNFWAMQIAGGSRSRGARTIQWHGFDGSTRKFSLP
jgi:hypothetical protein